MNHVLGGGPDLPLEEEILEVILLEVIIRHAQICCGQYSQPYSIGGHSGVASGYRSTVATCSV